MREGSSRAVRIWILPDSWQPFIACQNINHRTMTENVYSENAIYKPGTLLVAKLHPLVQLRVIKYLQRIYYCERVGDEGAKQLVYFHRELVIP